MLDRGSKFKASEIIPSTGKYRCLDCQLIIDVEPKLLDGGSTFFSCPKCHSGDDGGPKGPQDRVWEFLG